MSTRIAIAGGGISGLATAYALKKMGYEVTVFEAESRAGGPIHTVERSGYRLETGPHTLLVRHKLVLDLLGDLGLRDVTVEADDSADTRYIARHGRPIALPTSPLEAVTTPLLSGLGRLRVLAEPFVPSAVGDVDETLAHFVTRRLGREVLEYLVDPFVGGVWAGNPDQLSARHTFPTLVELEQTGGSIAVGAIKRRFTGGDGDTAAVRRRLLSFENGMKTLVDAFCDRLDDELRLQTPVRKLRRDTDGWRVIFQRGRARRGETFDAVVSTIPTPAFAELEWEHIAPPAGAVEELSAMTYAPCCVVSLGFDRDDVGHPLDGFGLLVPRAEEFHILGALFVSSMFAGRAPDDQVLLTAFIGGARQPNLAGEDDQTLLDMARHDLGRLLDIDAAPEFHHVTRWPRAIPQYEVGHQVVLDSIDEIERELPQLFLAGNYRDHIGVPNLLCAADDHARKIDAQLD